MFGGGTEGSLCELSGDRLTGTRPVGNDRAVVVAKKGGKPSGAKGGREMDAGWKGLRKTEVNLR